MTCQEITEFLMAYLDGELSDDRRDVFEEHLGECPDCVNYLNSYRETIRLSRNTADAPSEMPEDLVRAILAARQFKN